MNHLPPKPAGSMIEEIDDFDGRTYRWRSPTGGLLRYFLAYFLTVWLCFWALGFLAAAGAIVHGPGAGPGIFLILWLAFWTLGGVAAMWMLYLLLRRPVPESVMLGHDSFHYDSGTVLPLLFMNPWYLMRHGDPNEPFGPFVRRRKRIALAKRDLKPVVLDRGGDRHRLYFDHGADRIEIGIHLREPEREWLAEVIQAWQAT